MTLPSKAARITAAIAARLAAIRVANGYLTDAGQYVWHGRQAIDPNTLPSTTLHEDEDLVERQRTGDQSSPATIDAGVLLPYIIEATDHCDPDNPNLTGHALVADIKRAIFADDLTWGGLAQKTLYTGRTLGPRPDGASMVTVTVRIQIAMAENLAQP
jgi:hypothetical protein